MRLARFAAFVLAAMTLFSLTAHAAPITYGAFGPNVNGVIFLAVTEDSPTDPPPLYGPPELNPIGLDFDPISYISSTSNGGSDTTNGQLNFTITRSQGIDQVSIREGGDYSLIGNPATASVNAILRATITEINTVPVAPIVLAPISNSGSFSAPPNQFAPWDLGLFLNIKALLGPNQSATRVDIQVNNVLGSTSQAGSAAFIAKKEFQFAVNTDISQILPEPGSFAVGGIALLGLIGRRRAHA